MAQVAVKIQEDTEEPAQYVGPFADRQQAELWICDQWAVGSAEEVTGEGVTITEEISGDIELVDPMY